MFLKRVIRCRLADEEFEEFDSVVTTNNITLLQNSSTTVMEIMGIGAHETLEHWARVETLPWWESATSVARDREIRDRWTPV